MLLAGLYCFHFPVWPQTPVPVALATELTQPRLAGSARLAFWGFDIYQATLWVEPGFRSSEPARHRFALELRYLRGFKGRDIAQRSIDEMRRISEFSEAQAKVWLVSMQAAFPDVGPGDRITGIHRPGQGVRFLANGRITVEMNDPEFARLFFGIWLSDKTSEPKMRLDLLGLTGAAAQP